ncbi:MAG TPA: single-stranded-DNA-specific exonuclease RecJ [Terriglobales bacterium]|nr:single-stranded-DNA-specific exonuclease RecJ [Terriglobales bacterium]
MRWQTKPCDHSAADALSSAAGLPSALSKLLLQRGIDTAERAETFLNPSLAQLHDPFLMLGMSAAVERLERAIATKERTLIYGDYDVDGTTAIVILKTCIELLGGAAEFHVPHRIREGYGMRDDVLERAKEAGLSLVISVDTGIRAFQEAETAKRLGLDLIVTDHHLPEEGEGVPAALAVLNPNQHGCGYPCKELCGAGVAFKIAQALLTRAGQERLIPSFLKMVAIATIADSVALVGENRVIAKLGLDGLRRPVNGGLKALMQVAKLEGLGRGISATDIAFRVAPRINAAGRMDIAADVVELFTSRDEPRQRELAAKLNLLNTDRQAEEARILAQIHQRLDTEEALQKSFCVVIAGDGWHRGVIGIAATRVVERTGKPALVIAIDENGQAHGSGRSISAFHLLDALESERCHGLFTRFGGHAHAVGFSMPAERVSELCAAMDNYARAHLTEADFVPILQVDAEVELGELTPKFLSQLQRMEPFGMSNREPVFVVRGARVMQPPRVLKEKHIKLRVGSGATNGSPLGISKPLDVLAWRMAERFQASPLVAGDYLDIAFTLEENTHPDFGGLQLVLKDFVAVPQQVATATAEA